MQAIDSVQLRRCVLAVSVLTDLDVEPTADGVVLPGPRPAHVPWRAIALSAGDEAPEGPRARHRVEILLRLHRLVAELGTQAAPKLHAASRLLALPRGHWHHLGPSWVTRAVPGGTLDLGIGVYGLVGDADRVLPLPPSVLEAAGIAPSAWSERLRDHADRMGTLAAARLSRDGMAGVIRPVGGCDVLALLSSRSLRRHLADGDGAGMRSLAAPTRRRAWFDLNAIDPAFVTAAWSLTDEPDRGLRTPVLITADEVTFPFQL
jgi:hypothetical protein